MKPVGVKTVPGLIDNLYTGGVSHRVVVWEEDLSYDDVERRLVTIGFDFTEKDFDQLP